MGLRARHTETIQQLKKAFLEEKHECQANADKKIAEMSKQANQVTSFMTALKTSCLSVVVDNSCGTTWMSDRWADSGSFTFL